MLKAFPVSSGSVVNVPLMFNDNPLFTLLLLLVIVLIMFQEVLCLLLDFDISLS